jgi:hypothetical protein
MRTFSAKKGCSAVWKGIGSCPLLVKQGMDKLTSVVDELRRGAQFALEEGSA